MPQRWPGGAHTHPVDEEAFEVVELPVQRPGDVNRHRHAGDADVRRVFDRVRPDLLDLHAEPFSAVTRQWLRLAPTELSAVSYTAQNIDKRWPPPFAQWETASFRRLGGIYPCSRQAASVVRGKGFSGAVEVLPLGTDPERFRRGDQRHKDPVWTLALVGRLVPEKGVLDAVHVLDAVRRQRSARLVLLGTGPEVARAQALAAELGVADLLEHRAWGEADAVADLYRETHVALVPSRATRTWVEQFGRSITEAQACGAVVAGYASGSIPEVTGERGRLVPEGDAAALGDDVCRLAADASVWATLREAGLRHAPDLGWRAVARGQRALYEHVLAGGPGTRPVRPDRAAALREFGAPAPVTGGGRPFALPVLREDTALSRALALGLDAAAALRSRKPRPPEAQEDSAAG